MVKRIVRHLVGSLICCLSMQSHAWQPIAELPNNEWKLVSIPNDPGGITFRELFPGELPSSTYGKDWAIYAFNSANRHYTLQNLTDLVNLGVGYWVIQVVSSDVTLSLKSDGATPVTQSEGCPDQQGCFEVDLATSGAAITWNLAGYPFGSSQKLDRTQFRIGHSAGQCQQACSLQLAEVEEWLPFSYFWRWSASENRYITVDKNSDIPPWSGLWIPVTSKTLDLSPSWMVPYVETLPPHPGEAGKTTLAGADIDDNGVRDDVQIWISSNYSGNDYIDTRLALFNQARAFQGSITDGYNKQSAVNYTEQLARATECLASTVGGNVLLSREISLELQALMLNTVERSRAYLRFEQTLSGYVGMVNKPSNWGDSCGQ